MKFLPSFLILFLISCTTHDQLNIRPQSEADSTPSYSGEEESFPALASGQIELGEEVFGDIIELSGTSHPVEPFFKVQETQLLAKKDTLYIKNRSEDYYFMAYSLPSFEHIRTFGRRGRGPEEFHGPNIIQGSSPDYLFSVYSVNGKVYHVSKSFEIIDSNIAFDTERQLYDPFKICAASEDEYYYVGVGPVAKEIFRYSAKDSVPETSIMKLSVKGFKGWAAYTGYLGANIEKDRLVFAYKYFKRIVFTDLKGSVERVIDFDTGTKTEKQSNVSILGPSSVTYYWGLSAQKDYVYLLYSGRTPLVVTEELRDGPGYIYVEQFDWNGNPIRKFKLDHWGYFCVDDKEESIFLASITDENPIYSYRLPVNPQMK